MHHSQAYQNDPMYSACRRCDRRHSGCHGYGPPCQCSAEALRAFDAQTAQDRLTAPETK